MTKAQRIKAIATETGSLSNPSKMPCFSYSLPAYRCKVGSLLRKLGRSKKIPTACSGCYAMKGFYIMPSVKAAMEYRYSAILALGYDRWAERISELIQIQEKSGFFRWHDSGDLIDHEHMLAIFQVAKNLPSIRFWIPTRELAFVRKAVSIEPIPSNLAVRVSNPLVDKTQSLPSDLVEAGVVLSDIQRKVAMQGSICPANTQEDKCMDCRTCWDRSTTVVVYNYH